MANRFGGTLGRYVIREFIPNWALGLGVFTFVLLINRMFELFSLLINKGVSLPTVGMLFLCMLPGFFMLSLPMSLLAAGILTFGRFSQEGEVTAARSCGVSMWNMSRPVLQLCAAVFLTLVVFNSEVVPRANAAFGNLYYQILYKNPVRKLEPGQLAQIGGYWIFARQVEPLSRQLKKVVLYQFQQERKPLMLVAESGHVSVAPGEGLVLDLRQGKIFANDFSRKSWQLSGEFEHNQTVLLMPENPTALKPGLESAQQLPTRRLLRMARTDPYLARVDKVEASLRLSLAFVCLAFGILGCGLGMLLQKAGRGLGFGLSMLVLFGYYILLTTGITLGQSGGLGPWFGPWLATIAATALGSVVFWKVLRQ